MPQKPPRTYVGFGFGAIQAGLFLYEACQSRAFDRLVVAEVMPEVVASVRGAGGAFSLNIAHRDGIEHAKVGPVEIYDPAVAEDREALVAAIAEAQEIGTAVPGVGFYESEGAGSLHRVLAAGLHRKQQTNGPRAVVYVAENHNYAAEILSEKVAEALPGGPRDAALDRVRFLNTVIGKMSGVVSDPGESREAGLAPVVPGAGRAFLVEVFNRILISRIAFGPGQPFRRGIAVFEEKDDLLPFEEAKLYGHNAVHALAAYLGAFCGVRCIADLVRVPGMMAFLRAAFIDESGAALVRKHAGTDALFSAQGYAAYADDLLSRMVNPFLRDTVERVGRHPERKLGWDDRLIGTCRVALGQGVRPGRFALGAAAALVSMRPEAIDNPAEALRMLDHLWGKESGDTPMRAEIRGRVATSLDRLIAWRRGGLPADWSDVAI